MANLWGLVNFDGSPGDPVLAAEIGADLIDGSGSEVYGTPGLDGIGTCMVTTGQSRSKKALVVPPLEEDPGGPLPAEADVWVRIRRASGAAPGNNTNGTPSTGTNIVELNAASNVTQLGVSVTAAGRFTLVTADGSGVSNVLSVRTIYCDNNAYDAVLEIHQATDTAALKIHAGPDHPDFPEGYLLDDLDLTGTGVGAAQLTDIRVGSMASGASAHVQRLDHLLVSDTAIVITEPGDTDVDLQQVTARPTEHGFVLSVKCNIGDQYRMRVWQDGTEMPDSPTEGVEPISGGAAQRYAKLEYDGVDDMTRLEWQVQGRVGGVWENASQPHEIWTLPKPREQTTQIIKLGLVGCQQSSNETWGWDDLDDFDPHWIFHGGDYDYANDPTPTLAAQLAHLENQQAVVSAQRKAMRDRGGWVIGSDHDMEGADDVFATDCIPYAKQAFETIFSYPDLPVAGALAFRFWLGRVQVVVADFRTLDRTDPFAVDWDTNGKAWSDEQQAQLKAWIEDPQAAGTIFMIDAPFHTPVDLSENDKGDHLRKYPVTRADLGDSMLGRNGIICHFDFHGVGADDGTHNPDGGWPVTTNAGIKSGAGEANRQHNGGDDQWSQGYWPPEGNPDSIKVATYGQLTITDTGDVITVDWVGRSMHPDVEDHTIATLTRSWFLTGGVPRQLYASLTIDGTPFHDPSNGRKQLEVPTALSGLIPEQTWMVDEGRHGAVPGRPVWKPGLLGVPLIVQATDKVELRDRLGKVHRMVRGNTKIVANYPDGEQREAMCAFREFQLRGYVDQGVELMTLFDVLEFWRDPLEVESSTHVTADGQEIILVEFAGSTAPLHDLTMLLRGPWYDVDIEPQDHGQNMSPRHRVRYLQDAGDDGKLTTARLLRITPTSDDGEYLYGEPSGGVGDPWLPLYSAFSTVGSPYRLEVPTGGENSPPRVKVRGSGFDTSTRIDFIGHRAFVSL